MATFYFISRDFFKIELCQLVDLHFLIQSRIFGYGIRHEPDVKDFYFNKNYSSETSSSS